MHDTVAGSPGQAHGFEGCSTCFPFLIDRTDLLEIPTTVPEAWALELDGCSADEARERQLLAVRRIRARSGLASIGMHPEPQFELRPNWRESYGRLLEAIADDNDAWLALPSEVNRHWRQRAWLAQLSGTSDRLEARPTVRTQAQRRLKVGLTA